jgi:uncharacterized protein (DUF1684 family)
VSGPPGNLLDLLDWRRRIFDLYAEVRRAPDPEQAWNRWRAVRDELFATHPQSPVPEERRAAFGSLPYFDYDPDARVLAAVSPSPPEQIEIAGSAGEAFVATRFATASFRLGGETAGLELYWLQGYAGGLFLSVRDSTSGPETYGAGRYLLDTVKGSDLGGEDGRLVLDFNFAYNPSCAYDPRWACPLAPPANRLTFPVHAGERAPEHEEGTPG